MAWAGEEPEPGRCFGVGDYGADAGQGADGAAGGGLGRVGDLSRQSLVGGRRNAQMGWMTTTIFFDESGFTGTDLTNRAQPFFTIASSTVPDEQAAQILADSFPGYGGAEFKFTNVWKRDRHRANLARFAERLPEFADQLFVWAMDKRFNLLVKMLDYLVEPMMYARGFDFYKAGYCQRYVNTVHGDILALGSEELYSDTVELWDRFARSPTDNSLAELRTFFDTQARQRTGPLSNLYLTLRQGVDEFIERNQIVEEFEESNEMQVTSMLSSVIWWRQRDRDDFAVVHDQSSSFFKNASMWAALVRNDAPPTVHQLGNGSQVEFPLRVLSTTSVTSHESAAVQLCDILAGLFAKMMRALQGTERDAFLMYLVRRGVGEITFSGVNPGQDRVSGLPPRRDGPDALDRMTELIRPELERVLNERKLKRA